VHATDSTRSAAREIRLYVGAKTGRDGIHAPTMASEITKLGSQRPMCRWVTGVLEKLLLEASLGMQTGALALQTWRKPDSPSTCEMGALGKVGSENSNSTASRRRETGTVSYEIMLSGVTGAMLLVCREKAAESESVPRFRKVGGCDAVEVGLGHQDKRRCACPARRVGGGNSESKHFTRRRSALQSAAGRGSRRWSASCHRTSKLTEFGRSTGTFKRLLGAANICSKRWVCSSTISMVQMNMWTRPERRRRRDPPFKGSQHVAGDAPTETSVVLLDPRGRDARRGPRPCRSACSGATPSVRRNCLNLANPRATHSLAVLTDGRRHHQACESWVPVTGGNVAFYNETWAGNLSDPVLRHRGRC